MSFFISYHKCNVFSNMKMPSFNCNIVYTYIHAYSQKVSYQNDLTLWHECTPPFCHHICLGFFITNFGHQFPCSAGEAAEARCLPVTWPLHVPSHGRGVILCARHLHHTLRWCQFAATTGHTTLPCNPRASMTSFPVPEGEKSHGTWPRCPIKAGFSLPNLRLSF